MTLEIKLTQQQVNNVEFLLFNNPDLDFHGALHIMISGYNEIHKLKHQNQVYKNKLDQLKKAYLITQMILKPSL